MRATRSINWALLVATWPGRKSGVVLKTGARVAAHQHSQERHLEAWPP
jgi:hypothetical protein